MIKKEINPNWAGYKEQDKETVARIMTDAKNEENKVSPRKRPVDVGDADNQSKRYNIFYNYSFIIIFIVIIL